MDNNIDMNDMEITDLEIIDLEDEAAKRFPPGAVVQNFRRETLADNAGVKFLYIIVGLAKDFETGDWLMIYKPLVPPGSNSEGGPWLCSPSAFYAQDLEQFMSKVDHEKYPDVKQEYCFERYFGDKIGSKAAQREYDAYKDQFIEAVIAVLRVFLEKHDIDKVAFLYNDVEFPEWFYREAVTETLREILSARSVSHCARAMPSYQRDEQVRHDSERIVASFYRSCEEKHKTLPKDDRYGLIREIEDLFVKFRI